MSKLNRGTETIVVFNLEINDRWFTGNTVLKRFVPGKTR